KTSGGTMEYGQIISGIPIILLSFRCIQILMREKYRTNSFCRIFIPYLVSNSVLYCILMHNLRLPGRLGVCLEIRRFLCVGLLSHHYQAISQGIL
ncbi:hypothetical protein PENTCL1PPCAC_4511, partial [Pristionchus entomophagus]